MKTLQRYELNDTISDKERVALWETHGWGGRLSCNYPLIRDAFKALRTGEISDKLRAVLYDEIMIRLGNEQFDREAHGGAGGYEPARNPTDADIFEYIEKECKAADDAILYYRQYPTDTNAKYFTKKLQKCTFA